MLSVREGSSETTRKEKVDNSIIKNYDFFFWFIGFTEGDGSFIVNKNGTLEFKVTQSSNDAQVLFYIKKNLGFGSVRSQDKVNNTHHFRVRDKKGFLKIIQIFNGFLFTEKKTCQFKIWLEAFNLKYKESIDFIIPNIPFTINNSWLSGFTDAEGCFSVSIINRQNGYTQVQVRYILSQKNELKLFKHISLLINGKISYLKSYEGYNLIVNLTNLAPLIKYFAKYPLKTKKHIKYLTWLKIYYLVTTKKHLTLHGLTRIKLLKNKINKELSTFKV